ncbi:hypothetical protein U5801_18855 [Lamprobacter modestohalophilus]|uniref:hypothetical protein n=1 Tax=Lamprobacter modestohalophilus TaxID=1064514 RepID=UPI002ADEF9C3|nr:hypothetical protein [Lamprobacter modestohalophilus]MEA1051848.1 hypothetical protein [Lamprobacter modestohalophilus]
MAELEQRSTAQTVTRDNLALQADSVRHDDLLVQTSPPLTLVDAGIIGLVLGLALWYLARQFFRRSGCSGCAKGREGACVVSRLATPSSTGRSDSALEQAPGGIQISVDSIRKRPS